MYRGMTVIPSNNRWAAIGDALARGYMAGKQDAQLKKDNIAEAEALFPGAAPDAQYNPAPVTLTNAQPQQGQGLLSGLVSNSSSYGNLAETSPNAVGMPQPSAVKNMVWTRDDIEKDLKSMLTGQIESVYAPSAQPQAQTKQAPTGWASVKQGVNQGMRQELINAAKTMSPSGYAKFKAARMQRYNQDLADAKAQFDKEEMGRNIDAFEAEQDPRKKIALGWKSGLIGKEGAMMLLQPGTETKVINTGGDNVVVGFNKFTGRYVNLKDGSDIDPAALQEMLKPTLTPGQVQQGELTRESNAIRAARGGGGSATEARYIEIPGLGKMTVGQALSLKGQYGPKQVQYEENGMVKTRQDPGNPDIVALIDSAVGPIVAQARSNTPVDQNAVMSQAYNDVSDLIYNKKMPRTQVEQLVRNNPQLRAAGIDPELFLQGIDWGNGGSNETPNVVDGFYTGIM
jgi:hypothetical protein